MITLQYQGVFTSNHNSISVFSHKNYLISIQKALSNIYFTIKILNINFIITEKALNLFILNFKLTKKEICTEKTKERYFHSNFTPYNQI